MEMPGFGMSLCLSFSASSDRFGRLGTSRGSRVWQSVGDWLLLFFAVGQASPFIVVYCPSIWVCRHLKGVLSMGFARGIIVRHLVNHFILVITLEYRRTVTLVVILW